jgi:alpha-tubulin suppressor-like RCC1 family protein
MLDIKGNVYGLKDNYFGQLGLGDTHNRNTPTRIEDLPFPIKAISAGSSHSLVLDVKGNVYSSGDGMFGQLGLGSRDVKKKFTIIEGLHFPIKAISAGRDHSLLLDMKGNVYSFGANYHGQLGLGDNRNRDTPTKIEPKFPIIDISAGGTHSLISNMKGYAYAFGNNTKGQLGVPIMLSERISFPSPIISLRRVFKVSAGESHSLVIGQKVN